ncbi:NAD(P)/FAD-dependent oxidoreductase [Hymenobacter cellulosilyticus]|uniref:NAD(P)/FAD-dependent oxidoreductase n=1 Tax=Hymenobacter cellulosilyticus TaxID=2932248 RepID=A0A8T9Q851_9BACT|nr:NAD(P)/FAD-dependent oxidoreductase [Hymenobacter cellulosilyticus]UOQ73122.1 NAD(P)/FAD-dependent oxidoreductase [Hymenobacter cellulosilyticus]
MQSFFTRDGIKPAELLRIGLEQLRPYTTVEVRPARVTQLATAPDHFELQAEGESGRTFTVTARKVLLATGVEDELPPVPGMRDLWGHGVLHCPYCHGWEVRGQALAVYGRGKMVTGMALLISRWATDVIVCTDGPGHLSENARRRLRQQKIRINEEPISHLEGKPNGELRYIVFENGEKLARHAIFVHPHQHQRASFAEQLGCRLTSKGAIWIDKHVQTSVRGCMPPATSPPAPESHTGCCRRNPGSYCHARSPDPGGVP